MYSTTIQWAALERTRRGATRQGAFKGARPRLEGAVLGAGDDLILQGLAQVTEVIAVAGHPDNQIPVLLGVCLCGPQGLGPHHVELDVVAVQLEVGADQRMDLPAQKGMMESR